MKSKYFVLLLFVISIGCFAENKFENNRYYYWSDAGGEWFFEFNNGIFTLYDFQIDAKNTVPLPDYEDEMRAIKNQENIHYIQIMVIYILRLIMKNI